jgi:mRNA-degrading endonuclease toxin of MazEF toxin-antitoxin module
VAKRGEVLVARRKLGFGEGGKPEHFVVLQSDQLRDLDTVIVAPLDVDDAALYKADPLVVKISPREAGSKRPHVVLVHLLSAVLLDRFEPAHVSKLSPASMAKVDALLKTSLGIP